MNDIDIPFTAAEVAAAGKTYAAKSTGKQVSTRLDLRAMAASKPPEYDFVLPGFLRGSVGALVSPGGVGKSIFALTAAASIACAVASGGDLMGLGIERRGRVVYLAGEDPENALHHRFRDLMNRFLAAQHDAIFDGLDIYNMIDADRDLLDDQWVDWLIGAAMGARLIIIDTLSRFHRVDENDSGDAKMLMRRMERIAVHTGAAVLFLHHVSKASAVSGTADTQQAARGSSVFVDDARWASFLAGMTKAEAKELGYNDTDRRRFVRWNVCKHNYSAPLSDLWFKRGKGGVLELLEHIAPIDQAEAASKARDAYKKASQTVAATTEVGDEKTDFEF